MRQTLPARGYNYAAGTGIISKCALKYRSQVSACIRQKTQQQLKGMLHVSFFRGCREGLCLECSGRPGQCLCCEYSQKGAHRIGRWRLWDRYLLRGQFHLCPPLLQSPQRRHLRL